MLREAVQAMRGYFQGETPRKPLVLLISEGLVRENWDAIKSDPHNNRPDIEDVDTYLEEIAAGRVLAGGVKVYLAD